MNSTWTSLARPDLGGHLALITCASRGVGRGIAIGLGSCGATVVVTGRSLNAAEDKFQLGSSILDTCDLVRSAGGSAIPMVCDHSSDDQVARLFAQIADEVGPILTLVNNAWGGYESIHTGERWNYSQTFWEQPLGFWDEAIAVGLRGAFICSWHAARVMCEQNSGLIVNVSAGNALMPDGRVAYGVAKSASARMIAEMSIQLRPFSVASVCLMPGLVRTESVLKAAAAGVFDLQESESPELQGLAIAGLIGSGEAMALSGGAFTTAELARRFGLTV